jgi:alanine racemase
VVRLRGAARRVRAEEARPTDDASAGRLSGRRAGGARPPKSAKGKRAPGSKSRGTRSAVSAGAVPAEALPEKNGPGESLAAAPDRPLTGAETTALAAVREASAVRPVARHSSRIELSMAALRNNVRFVRSKVGTHPVISAVVKANAYGHGIDPFVPMAEQCGIHHFSVSSSYEANEVLSVCSDETRIMIMGIIYPQDLPWIIEHGLEFYVFDLTLLEKAAEVAGKVGAPAVVHLEVETGGNRTGLDEASFLQALAFIKAHRRKIRFEGFCTHLGGIETLANQFRIKKQLARFEALGRKMRSLRITPAKRHVAASAAALAFPETLLDLVRVGTALYGMWPSPDIYNLHLLESPDLHKPTLQRVLTWKTNVMHLKSIARDEFVGYGTAFQAAKDMTVAVLPVGYSNGFPRELSNRGHVLVRGRKCPVVGLVNMNVCMVDVTHVPGVQVGDEVVLVGKQKKNVIPIRSFSEFSNALNNEFISRLPADVPRTVVR